MKCFIYEAFQKCLYFKVLILIILIIYTTHYTYYTGCYTNSILLITYHNKSNTLITSVYNTNPSQIVTSIYLIVLLSYNSILHL